MCRYFSQQSILSCQIIGLTFELSHSADKPTNRIRGKVVVIIKLTKLSEDRRGTMLLLRL